MINIKERVLKEADHILKTKETIRETASKFKVSKSTVHKDVQERLKNINIELHQKIDPILREHFDNKHIKGGASTKEKYNK